MTHTPGQSAVIEASGLHKTYGATRAVDGVDLTVGVGEVVAMLGPNGAGKTTLIEMLLGMRRPDSGQVRLFGQRPDDRAVKARIGAMLQEVDTPQALSVAETLALVRCYYPMALGVHEALRRADLTEHASKRASKLSGGQRQRLSFAMAIVGDPDLLFLDEPTASLDVEARRAFWEQVRGFATGGTTVLFASHNMAEVEALADRVVVVHRGRIVADGTPAYIAGTVATRLVKVTTDAPAHVLEGLPGVVRLRLDNHADNHVDNDANNHADRPADPPLGSPERPGPGLASYVLTCSSPEDFLRELYARGPQVEHLVVADADMETAFLHLTSAEEVSV